MAKAKSSASSATKKKQARKAEKRQQLQAEEAQREEQEQELEIDGQDSENDPNDGQETAESKQEDASKSTADPSISTSTPSQTAPPAVPVSVAQQTPSKKTGKQAKQELPAQGKQRGEKKNKKQSKKHKKGEAPPPPRKKQYIPPPKPPRDNVDPVDIYGLGVTGTGYERVSAERIVTLRLLNKKDSSSVERGIEEVSSWITAIGDDLADEGELQQVAEFLPVWVHHLPRLLSHTSRRVRYGAASIHAHLLHRGPSALLNDYTLPTLNAPITLENEDYLASLLCSAFDPDRQVRTTSVQTWQALQKQIALPDYLTTILSSLNDTILTASGAATSGTTPSKLAKMDDETRMAVQEEQDQKRNQLAASVDAYAYLLDQHVPSTGANQNAHPGLEQPFEAVLSSTDNFWTYLSPRTMEAAQVRRATWRCLNTALSKPLARTCIEEDLPVLCKIVLDAAFSERDYNTQNTLYPIALRFLHTYNEAWRLSGPEASSTSSSAESEDSENEDPLMTDAESRKRGSSSGRSTIPGSFQQYLTLLQVGFYGNATAGYPLVFGMLQTLPRAVLSSSANLEILFSSLWAGYSGRAIEAAGLQGVQAFTLCIRDLVRNFATPNAELAVQSVCAEQVQSLWQYYLGLLPSPSRLQSLSRPATLTGLVGAVEAIASAGGSGWQSLQASMQNDGRSALAVENKSRRLDLLTSAFFGLSASSNELVQALGEAMQKAAVQASIEQIDDEDAMSMVVEILDRNSGSIVLDASLIQVRAAPQPAQNNR